MNNGDKPAFLEKIIEHPRGGNEKSFGLSKREYFAAMAMQGILSNNEGIGPINQIAHVVVKDSIIIADELLKQLEQ